MKRINSKYLHTGTRWLTDASLILNAEGRIEKVCPQHEADHLPHRYEAEWEAPLVIPGCVNTHSHAFQVLLRPTMGQPQHFHDWVDRFLYPLVETLNEEQLYASALLAFSEMLRGGITTVGEFFYVHNLADGTSSRQRHAQAVIEAARDVGLRIVLIRALYDQASKPGQQRFYEPADQALSQTAELAKHYARIDGVSVLPAPHSLHGASRELIEGAAELAQQLKTPWHIHLAEQQSDIAFAQQRYGHRPLQCLDAWGILSEATTLVHGIWLDEEDRELMARRKATLAYNPQTNMALGDGIARIPDLLSRGVRIALGTDANLTSELFGEARLTEYLQRVQQLQMGQIPDIRVLFRMLNVNGGPILGQPVGQLEPGYYADALLLDTAHPSLWPALDAAQPETALLNQLIFSMIPQEAIQTVIVGGREVVQQGETCLLERQSIQQRLQQARQV